jgi:SagB-type dehydrogenase family enzyme
MTGVQEKAVHLPAARGRGRMSLEEAIAARRSRRAYTSDPLKLSEVGQLLWAAQGITGPEQQRTAPSAGALYPLETYLAATRVEGLAPGVYKYRPASHDLVLTVPGDLRRELTAAASDQDCVRFSACVVMFAAVYERTTVKYGDHGVSFVRMEAAHASQNVYLQATSLGLGTVAVGKFDAGEVRRIAGLAEGEEPVYLMAVGKI